MDMTKHILTSLVIAVLCGLWYALALFLKIPAWIFFAGCTSYFIAGGGRMGALKAYAGNLSGLAWAGAAIWISSCLPGVSASVLATGLISGLMAYQAKYKLLSVTTTAFLGCTITFASGNYFHVAVGMLLGILLGALCDVVSNVGHGWIDAKRGNTVAE